MERDNLVAVALGEQPADLVVVGGQLVNVYSGEIYPAGIAVAGDRIAAVGDVDYCIGPQTQRVEAGGRLLVPGMIECHFHFGASSLVVTELARLLVPLGTAAIVTDFVEAGRMQGVRALRFFLDEAARTPLRVFFSPFWTLLTGVEGRQSVSRREFEEILTWPECVELREWNVQTARHASAEIATLGRYAEAQGRRLAGHLRGQAGKVLQASVAAGTVSDHEAKTTQEAIDRIRLGVAVQMRYGSAHWYELPDLLRAVTEHRLDSSLLMFSTDEQEVDDIARLGFMDHRVRMAIEQGVAPIEAVRMATLNPATYLGKTGDLGSLTPGRLAFINLVEDFRTFRPSTVIAGGQVVGQDGRYVGDLPRPEYPASFYNTIHLKSPITAAALETQAPAGKDTVAVRVMGFDDQATDIEERHVSMAVVDGVVRADPARDIAKLASIERHAGNGKIGTGFVQGLGVARGALAFSYHPGPSQIGVVGMSEADMALAANRLAELGGGFVVVLDGEVLAEVPFPVLGIVSDAPVEQVAAAFRQAKQLAKERLGLDMLGSYYRLTILFIPGVAPQLRMSVDGLLRIELKGEQILVTRVPVLLNGAETQKEPA